MLAGALLATGLLQAADGWALSPGREWMPVDTTKVPGHTRLYAHRLELDSRGTPLVFAALVGGIGRGTCALSWADSAWSEIAELDHGVGPMHQVVSREHRMGLVWTTLGSVEVPGVGTSVHLVMSEFEGGGFGPPDTLGLIRAGFWIYSGAMAGRRRWVVDNDGNTQLLAWYSDTAHVWRRLQLPWGAGAGDYGVAVSPVDDTTALVIYATQWPTPLRWGLLQGDICLQGGDVPAPMGVGIPSSPNFHLSPSGALWLGWSTSAPLVRLARYQDAAWSDTVAIEPAGDLPWDRYLSRGLWLSRDGWELPTVMWAMFDTYSGWTGSIYVSVPCDSGYPPGEFVPGSLGGEYGDVVRDRNGDVWVAWKTETDGMFWTHSYTRATCSAPAVRRYRGDLLVTARLSEPAPETWWAVERAGEGEPFTEVARVRVRDSVRVGWLDQSRPRGPVRYRIRRECLDTRYQWWSGETEWPQCRLRTLLLRLREWLGRGLLAFEVEGAAPGPLEVTLHDVAGRRVLKRGAVADADGRLDYRLDLDGAGVSVGSGVYFLSVRDARGERAAAAKIVVLR